MTLNITDVAATTYTWVGGLSGSWTQNSNWSPSTGYPGSSGTTDVAQIQLSLANITLSSSITISSLQTQNYGTYGVTITMSGSPTVNISSLTVAQPVASLIGITFTGPGTVNIATSPSFGYAAGFGVGVNATVNFASGAAVSFNNPPSFVCDGTLNLNNATFTTTTSSTISSTGTLNISGASASFSTSAATTNNGTINCTSGTFYTTSDLTNNNKIALTSNALFDFPGTPSIFTNTNTLTLNSSTIRLNNTNCRLINSGSATVTGVSSTFNMAGAGTYITNSATFKATACSFPFGNGNNIQNSGTFTTQSACTFGLTTSSSYFSNTGTFRDHGSTFTLSGQSCNIQNTGSGNFYGSGTTITFGPTNNNHVINNTNIFKVDSASVITIGTFTSAITNSGTFYCGTSNSACNITLTGQSANIANTNIFYVGSTSVITMSGVTENVTNTNPGIFTLQSDQYGSAAFGAINSGCTAVGLFNVERFLTGGGLSSNRGYRLLSSPVNQTSAPSSTSNTVGLNYLNSHVYRNATYAGAFTAGPGGTSSGFSYANTNPTIYVYRENLNNNNSLFTSGKNVAVIKITTTNTTSATGTTSTIDLTNTQTGSSLGQSLPVANGFLMYFVGPSSRTDGSTSTAPANTTLTAGGYINQGDVTVNLWYSPNGGVGKLGNTASLSPGYNMVGNPYPCTINLATVLSDNNSSTGIDNIYLLSAKNSPNQVYTAYTPSGTSAPLGTGGRGYAASGEGFMVHAKSSAGISGALTFKESEKAPLIQLTGSSSILSAPERPILTTSNINTGRSFNQLIPVGGNTTIQSIQDGLTGLFMKMEKDSTTYDYCGIYFNDQWDAKFHDGDALDLDGAGPRVYMSSYSSDGIRSAVKHFPDYKKGALIRLYADSKTDGLYKLKIEGIQNIDTLNYKITLLDHFKNDSLDIGRYKSYAFNILKSDTNTFGANRFKLSIRQLPTSAYQLASFNAQKATDGVLLTWRAYNEGNNYSFSLEKQQANGINYSPIYQLQSNGGTIYKYTDKTPNAGNNIYRLKQVDLFGNITYSALVNIYYDKSGNVNMFTLYPNPTAETINVNVTYGKTSSATTGSYKLNIYDAAGTLVTQRTSANSSWSENVSQFKPGVYIVELTENGGNSLGKAKFVKK